METGEQEDGNCEGPNSMYITLVSSDGFEFIIKRKVASLSKAINVMCNGSGRFSENVTNRIYLKTIP